MNATRFAQKPLPQPMYNFSQVPKPSNDLRGSSLQKVTNREDFQFCMGEMLLLCKQAIRNRRQNSSNIDSSKPLSLEYLADRMDVDDPLWGLLIRNAEGMLQGFCTVTTFTNYQQTFRWDSSTNNNSNSTYNAAFDFDNEEMEMLRIQNIRKWDNDGSLARGLQNSVRAGDVWNEGIVWPRVAELGLLGGLGCGRTLVKLVIEELECTRPTGKANYDYLVLQATDNSIPFYESMGFVRVGAVTEEDEPNLSNDGSSENSNDSDDNKLKKSPRRQRKQPVANIHNGLVSSKTFTYTTKKNGEKVNEIAKELNVDVWDVVFLNQRNFAGISPTSKLLAGTELKIPDVDDDCQGGNDSSVDGTSSNDKQEQQQDKPQWYKANDDETPRMIAKRFQVDCLALVEANKARLPGLLSNSKLMKGTPMKVSHFNTDDSDHHHSRTKPYAHWAFPDDEFEDGEPSYMMALKLNRNRKSSKQRPVLDSLAVPMIEYTPSHLLVLPKQDENDVTAVTAAAGTPSSKMNNSAAKKKKKKKCILHPDAPVPPKRPMTAYILYANQQRSNLNANSGMYKGMSLQESSRMISDQWKALPDGRKKRYENIATESRKAYATQKQVYEAALAQFQATHPEVVAEAAYADECATSTHNNNNGPVASTDRMSLTGGPASEADIKYSLFNKVVRLKPGAMTEGSESTYWYVLTYIPDLKWCHLAPMIQVGTFGDSRPKHKGRPKWKLVDEQLGLEVDISSSFCIPITSKSVRRTHDADKEEWDIVDDGSDPCARPPSRRKSIGSSSGSTLFESSSTLSSFDNSNRSNNRRSGASTAAIKPSAVERKRKRKRKEASTTTTVSTRVLITYTDEEGGRVKLDHALRYAEALLSSSSHSSASSSSSTYSLAESLEEASASSFSSTETEISEVSTSNRPSSRLSSSSSATLDFDRRGESWESPKNRRRPRKYPTPESSPKKRGRPRKYPIPECSPKKRGRPRKYPTPEFARAASGGRPRRKSAPLFLGESHVVANVKNSSKHSTPNRKNLTRRSSPRRTARLQTSPRRSPRSLSESIPSVSLLRQSPRRATGDATLSTLTSDAASTLLFESSSPRRSPRQSRTAAAPLVSSSPPSRRSSRHCLTDAVVPLVSTIRRDTHRTSTALSSLAALSSPVESSRPKRKAAPIYLGLDSPNPRKRRKTSNAGSARSVLQG